mmetsp:Transcript_30248/g.43230  ORF Transcript_30248/g.43230 Transcript_30248/m.43230 type:complete len:443 (+) Transcript_30248:41-1369(+)
MDFFKSSGDRENLEDFKSPLGLLVKNATVSSLNSPDWSLNLDICDRIDTIKDGPDQTLRAIFRRLKDSNPNTQYLALIVMETCIKNCGINFARHVDKPIMNEIATISRGNYVGPNKPSDEALRLIQQWGKAFESKRQTLPVFYDTYHNLKGRGVVFPKDETTSAIIFETENQKPTTRSPQEKQSSSIDITNTDEFEKLQSDLLAVMEKVKMCREMLLVSPGIQEDELLADVVGYLEACRDRLTDVIEAGTHGVLGEELFAQCLKVNDAVIRTLDAERSGVAIAVEDDGSSVKREAEEEKKVDLLDLNSSPPSTSKSTQPNSLLDSLEEELFGSSNSKPAVIPVSSSFPLPASSSSSSMMTAHSFAAPAYDPFFSTSKPQHPQPPITATPTPFDEIFPATSAVPHTANNTATVPAAQPPAAVSMEDDFDAFFESLGKNGDQLK